MENVPFARFQVSVVVVVCDDVALRTFVSLTS